MRPRNASTSIGRHSRAGSVLKRGQELLIGPVLHLQHIAQMDAARIERDLATALASAGIIAEGGHSSA